MRRKILSNIVPLFIGLVFFAVLFWEAVRMPYVQDAWKYVDQKLYEITKISNAEKIIQRKAVFDTYKPETDLSKYTLPSNIQIKDSFPQPVLDIIKEQAFKFQQFFPIEKLGNIFFYRETEYTSYVPAIFPDSGVSYIPSDPGGATDANSTELYVQRTFSMVFAYRILSQSDKAEWEQIRFMKRPLMLDKNWDYQTDPSTISFKDMALSPMEDFGFVMVHAFVDTQRKIFTAPTDDIYPMEKIFIRGQIAKLLKFDSKKSEKYGLSPAALIMLKNRTVSYTPYIPADYKRVCLNRFDPPIMKDNRMYYTCDNGYENKKQLSLSLAIYKNKQSVKDIDKLDFEKPMETIPLKNEKKAYVLPIASPRDDWGDSMAFFFDYMVYQIPGSEELVVVQYPKNDKKMKNVSIELITSIEPL
jgi:hypothetical protein